MQKFKVRAHVPVILEFEVHAESEGGARANAQEHVDDWWMEVPGSAEMADQPLIDLEFIEEVTYQPYQSNDLRARASDLYWDEIDYVEMELHRLHYEAPERFSGKTEEDVRDSIYQDPDYLHDIWEWVVGRLDEILEEVNPQGRGWHIHGQGMGWQRRSGYRFMESADAEKLLRAVTGGGDVHFYMRKLVQGDEFQALEFIVYTHDAPTGEVYQCTLAEADEEDGDAD